MLDNQLRSQIILYIIDPVYLATLRLPYVGIGTRTPLEIMAHLYINYAKITPANLDNNDRAMKQPCDVNQPIEVLYQQIEDVIEFAAAGQTPYSPRQVLNVAYQLIFRTGIVKSGNANQPRITRGPNSNWISPSLTKSTARRWTSPPLHRVSIPKRQPTSKKRLKPSPT
jgi:hypothetical protein